MRNTLIIVGSIMVIIGTVMNVYLTVVMVINHALPTSQVLINYCPWVLLVIVGFILAESASNAHP